MFGRKDGLALTMDVFAPARANGLGLIFLVSGGFASNPDMVRPWTYGPLVARGFTVFAAAHGSLPRYTLDEIHADVHRAVRWVRANALTWRIDPERLGVYGVSSGGHLTLMLATRGGSGDPGAADPVDTISSAVQAAACFCPPSDYANYGRPGCNAVLDGPIPWLRPGFGPAGQTEEGCRTAAGIHSPLRYIHAGMPPVWILHGASDTVVPAEQSVRFAERARAAGATVDLEIRPGRDHDWSEPIAEMDRLAGWFGQRLSRAETQLQASRPGGFRRSYAETVPAREFFTRCAFVCVDLQEPASATRRPALTEADMPPLWRALGFTAADVNAGSDFAHTVCCANAARVADTCRALGLPRVFIHWGSRFADEMDLDPEIRVLQSGDPQKLARRSASPPAKAERPAAYLGVVAADDYVLPKTAQDAFASCSLDHVLRNLGVERLILIGGHTGACLGRTARSARRLGYETLCVEDATNNAFESNRIEEILTTGYDYIVKTDTLLRLAADQRAMIVAEGSGAVAPVQSSPAS